MWLTGLLAIVLWLGVGILIWRWAELLPNPRVPPPQADTSGHDTPPLPAPFGERLAAWRPGWDGVTGLLVGAVD